MTAAIQEAALHVAVVGAGRWGTNLVRVLVKLPRCRLVAICDTEPARAAMAHAVAGCRFTSRYEEIVAAPDVEAVVIATPPNSHAELALRALREGKHVYVEKPLALSVRDALAVRAAASRHARRVMVGHILEYHPAIVELKRMVRSGLLGVPRLIVAERLSPISARQHTDDAWWTFAPHDVSMICSLLGAQPSSVAAVQDGVVIAQLAFAGCTATVRVGYVDGPKVRRLLVAGTWRTALFDDTLPERKLAIYPRLERVPSDCAGFRTLSNGPLKPLPLESLATREPENVEPLEAELRHFVDAVVEDKPIRTGVAVGLSAVRILEAGAASIISGGRAVKLSEARDQRFANT